MQLDDLLISKKIGEGNLSQVFLSQKIGSNIIYAVKVYDRAKIDHLNVYNEIKKELTNCQMLNHQNIIKIVDIKKTINHFYIIYEYCNGGDLSTILDIYKKKYGILLSEKIIHHLVSQIIGGLIYIHNLKLIHDDINIKNIFIHFDNEKDRNSLNLMNAKVKITHFRKMHKRLNKALLKKTVFKTYDFEKEYEYKKDIFNLGKICLKMIYGTMFHLPENVDKLMNEIEYEKYHNPKFQLSLEFIGFLKDMLKNDLSKVLRIEDLSKSPFLKKHFNDTQTINQKDSNNNKLVYLCSGCKKMVPFLIVHPCRHAIYCVQCFKTFNMKNCPICKYPLISSVRNI